MRDKAIDELIKEASKWDGEYKKANSDPDNRIEVDENDDEITEEDLKEKEQERKIQQYQDNLDDRYDKQQSNKRDEHWNFP
jgi:hypothetical protein